MLVVWTKTNKISLGFRGTRSNLYVRVRVDDELAGRVLLWSCLPQENFADCCCLAGRLTAIRAFIVLHHFLIHTLDLLFPLCIHSKDALPLNNGMLKPTETTTSKSKRKTSFASVSAPRIRVLPSQWDARLGMVTTSSRWTLLWTRTLSLFVKIPSTSASSS